MALVVPAQPRIYTSAVGVTHTGATGFATLGTVALPAGIMGANGFIEIETLWSVTNSATSKIGYTYFGGIAGTTYEETTLTSIAAGRWTGRIANRNSASSQVGFAKFLSAGVGSSGNANTTSSIDTTAAVDIVFRGWLALMTDSITLESYHVAVWSRP